MATRLTAEERAILLQDLEQLKTLVEKALVTEEEGEQRRLQIVNKLTGTDAKTKEAPLEQSTEKDNEEEEKEDTLKIKKKQSSKKLISKSSKKNLETTEEEKKPNNNNNNNRNDGHKSDSDSDSSVSTVHTISDDDKATELIVKKTIQEKELQARGRAGTLTRSQEKKEDKLEVEMEETPNTTRKRSTTVTSIFRKVNSAIQELDRLRAGQVHLPTSSLPKVSKAEMKADSEITIQEFQYSATKVEEKKYASVDELSPSIEDWATVRWINCEGFNEKLMSSLQEKYHLNPMAVSDVQEVPHRPKLERYPKTKKSANHLFMIFQILSLEKGSLMLDREQVSIFVFEKTILTIQEGKPGDCWAGIRKTLVKEKRNSEIRERGVDYLAYCLVDALVDSFFKPMKKYGKMLEDAELALNEHPRDTFIVNNIVRKIKRELLFVQRMVRPMIDVITSIENEPQIMAKAHNAKNKKALTVKYFSSEVLPFFQDITSNIVRITDLLDTYKDICESLEGLHSNAQDHRSNEIMFSLAIVSVFFLPLTFLAGIYGMNFTKLPEVEWELGYLWFWGWVSLILIVVSSILKWKKVI